MFVFQDYFASVKCVLNIKLFNKEEMSANLLNKCDDRDPHAWELNIHVLTKFYSCQCQ